MCEDRTGSDRANYSFSCLLIHIHLHLQVWNSSCCMCISLHPKMYVHRNIKYVLEILGKFWKKKKSGERMHCKITHWFSLWQIKKQKAWAVGEDEVHMLLSAFCLKIEFRKAGIFFSIGCFVVVVFLMRPTIYNKAQYFYFIIDWQSVRIWNAQFTMTMC